MEIQEIRTLLEENGSKVFGSIIKKVASIERMREFAGFHLRLLSLAIKNMSRSRKFKRFREKKRKLGEKDAKRTVKKEKLK